MKKAALLALALLVSGLPGIAQAQTAKPVSADKQEKFDPSRDAAKDIEFGVALAKKQNKRVILDVGGEWCPWCKKLDKMFHEDKEVAAALKANYVVIKVNFSQENENKAVLSKYPMIQGYPHLFVLENDGKLLHSQDTGLLETGDHHDHDKVMAFLKKWAPPRGVR
ncbi:MAG: thioredoxin family protein [Armatimonadetes bacterium]|nr:thioredoxin family protein [Armatimonadota bacterium]